MSVYRWMLFFLLIWTCAGSPEEVGEEVQLPEQATLLNQAETAFSELRLWEALSSSRSLAQHIASNPANSSRVTRAMGHQYLSMLHFFRGIHYDSIAYHAAAAGRLIEPTDDALLRARQALCHAYVAYYDWAWLEVQLNAGLARSLLEEAGLDENVLYAHALVVEGRGAKQYGDALGDATGNQRKWWLHAHGLFQQAGKQLLQAGSPWARYAHDNRLIILSRLPRETEGLGDKIDRLSLGGDPGALAFGGRERLYGYWHYKNGRMDSIGSYYQALLDGPPPYHHPYLTEAFYMLIRQANAHKDYSQAIDLLHQEIQSMDCCPPDIDDPLECDRQSLCLFFLNPLADQYYDRYVQGGDVADLERAADFAQEAVNRYARAFRTNHEEGVVNKSLTLGDRIINAALRTAAARVAWRASKDHYTALFQAIETGKTFLLTQALLQAADSTYASGDGYEAAQQLRTINIELKTLKNKFARQRGHNRQVVGRFGRLRRQRAQLEAIFDRGRVAMHQPAILQQEIPTLSSVKDRLSGDQVLIEFAETDQELIILYVDDGRTDMKVLPIDSLRDELTDFLDLLAAPTAQPDDVYTRLATPVYERLLGSFATQLENKVEILIAPSPLVAGLPFAALTPHRPSQTGDTIRYLLDSHRIRYLESWQTYVSLHPPGAEFTPPASIAAWTHSDLVNYLGPLADTLLPQLALDSEHFADRQCTAPAFLAVNARYEWLHLAVHAGGNPNLINENYLYLGPNDSLNGVWLSNRQLAARMVVLAACSSADGFASRREGTFSLRRNLHQAGVPHVVASLFDIPAAATASLLEVFYRRLGQGDTPAEALTAAQRTCRSGALNPRWRWPAYWAGLTVS